MTEGRGLSPTVEKGETGILGLGLCLLCDALRLSPQGQRSGGEWLPSSKLEFCQVVQKVDRYFLGAQGEEGS